MDRSQPFPVSNPKRLSKRRRLDPKLFNLTSCPATSPFAQQNLPNIGPFLFSPPSHVASDTTAVDRHIARIVITTCVSCHRALSTAPAYALVCARCKASTCAICSRTCSTDPIPSFASFGPHATADLNNTSISMAMVITPPSSPKRRPLMTSENVIVMGSQHPYTQRRDHEPYGHWSESEKPTRRRKRELDESESESGGEGDCKSDEEGMRTDPEPDALMRTSMLTRRRRAGSNGEPEFESEARARTGCGVTVCRMCSIDVGLATFCLDCCSSASSSSATSSSR